MTTNNSGNQNTTGVQALSSTGSMNGRTISPTTNQTSISNGDGTGGNPTIALTSTIQVSGISFDSGSNTLSAYAVGTYNPTLSSTGTPPTVTYSTQVGRYVKFGNQVMIFARLVLASNSGGTGTPLIASLPFTSVNDANLGNIGTCIIENTVLTTTNNYMVQINSAPSTNLKIIGCVSASTNVTPTLANIGGTAAFDHSILYNI